MQEIFALIRRLSGSTANVLITGESGTGKELVARGHPLQLARGAKRPFVAVNCAAIPDTLLESRAVRLQARRVHRRAHATGPGMFVEADGGTLFLDEIGDLSAGAAGQAAARAAGSARSGRWGRRAAEKVDVRVRRRRRNRDLEAAAGATARSARTSTTGSTSSRSTCRRCATAPRTSCRWPSTSCAQHGEAQRQATSRGFQRGGAQGRCCAYGWPGNVRELENVIERAVALAEGAAGQPEDLPQAVRERRMTADVMTCGGCRARPDAGRAGARVHRAGDGRPRAATRRARRSGWGWTARRSTASSRSTPAAPPPMAAEKEPDERRASAECVRRRSPGQPGGAGRADRRAAARARLGRCPASTGGCASSST